MVNRDIGPYAARVWPQLFRTAVVTLLASFASIGSAVALARAFASILTGATWFPVAPLATAVALLLLRAGLLWLRDLSALHTGTIVADRIRTELLQKIVELGPGYQWPGGRSEAHLAAVDGCEHLKGYIGKYLPQAMAAVLVPTSLVAFLWLRDWAVAVVVLVGVAAVPLTQRVMGRVLGDRARSHWKAYDDYAARVGDSIAGLAMLAGMGAAERRGRVLTAEAEKLRAATTANMNASLSTYVFTNAAMLIGTAGATLLAAWNAAQGTLRPADVLLVLFLSAECFRPLQDLQSFWHEGFYGLAAAGAINRVLAVVPPVTSKPDTEPVRLAGPPGFRLRNVSFRYGGATRDSLHDVTIEIPGGRTTALVGTSGAGKTTLSALLLRDIDPSSGVVELVTDSAAHDLRDLPLDQLRAISARASQDVVLMDGTITDNVTQAASHDAPDIETAVGDALERARVTDFLPELPNGSDSPVGEGGRNLSGGQRQRIALARAIVQDAPVLILDEATSALDGENEALVGEAVRSQDSSRTVVVIAHRLSTVAHADHVIVLDDGHVREQGTPAELEAAGGRWTSMVRAQRIVATGREEIV